MLTGVSVGCGVVETGLFYVVDGWTQLPHILPVITPHYSIPHPFVRTGISTVKPKPRGFSKPRHFQGKGCKHYV